MDTIKSSSPERSTIDIEAVSIEKDKVRNGFQTWTKTLSVESGGIERVTDEQRQNNTTKVWNACTFWYV